MFLRVSVYVVALSLVFTLRAPAADDVTSLASPDEKMIAQVTVSPHSQLQFAVTCRGEVVLAPSAIGITVDGVEYGNVATVGAPTTREINERYACRGVKTEALNHCIQYDVPVTVKGNNAQWTLQVRMFDDGVAYRYCVPTAGRHRIGGEATSWQLPANSIVWAQHNTTNYEGVYQRYTSDSIPAQLDGKPLHIGCPVTLQLPQGGYALLSEACLYNYSGMTLRPAGDGCLQAVFQDDPQGWEIAGPVHSPWRVTIVTPDLNALVNSTLIANLGTPPDPTLFPQGANTPWIQPGRALCTWAVFLNDGAQWHRQKWFVDMCAAMNCQYLLIDGGWRSERWGFLRDGGDLWQRLGELCKYAAARNVDIFVWNAYPEGRDDGPGLTDPAVRKEFLRKCKEVGVRGVKIDFFDSERKEIIDVYEDILRETAELQLMVSFHGANKPTGEVRTWPHEITREGIREQEYVLWDKLPLPHYGALPFTRMVAGYGDFLPGFVRDKYLRNTTAVFQMATAVIYTSPFICWPDHPEAYLDSPFLSLVREMPPAWDETRVLPGSAIGSRVAFARRHGEDWYVAVLNCEDHQVTYDCDLSFLPSGEYQAVLYLDGKEERKSAAHRHGRPAHSQEAFEGTTASWWRLCRQDHQAAGKVHRVTRQLAITRANGMWATRDDCFDRLSSRVRLHAIRWQNEQPRRSAHWLPPPSLSQDHVPTRSTLPASCGRARDRANCRTMSQTRVPTYRRHRS